MSAQTRPPRYPWEDWQMDYILANAGFQTWKEIGLVVGKSPLATRLKAHRLRGEAFIKNNMAKLVSAGIFP